MIDELCVFLIFLQCLARRRVLRNMIVESSQYFFNRVVECCQCYFTRNKAAGKEEKKRLIATAV